MTDKTTYHMPETAEGEMVFFTSGHEFLRFKANGDIYVKGRLTDNDMAVVDALREWMLSSGLLRPDAVDVMPVPRRRRVRQSK